MHLVECLRQVDAEKPNSFSNEQKTAWLSTLEGQVYTQALLLSHYDFQPLTYQEKWLYQPGEKELAAGKYYFTCSWHENGLPRQQDYSFTLTSPLSDGKYLRWDGKELWLEDGDNSTALPISQGQQGQALTFQDQSRELLAAPPHDRIYPAYLGALIDFHHGEFDRYANSSMFYNELWDDFIAYICYTYAPANSRR